MKIQNPRSNLDSQFVDFSRRERAGNGFLVMNLEMETKAGFVPAKQVEEHRELIEQIWRSASRELSVFKGYARPRQTHGFGVLPSVPMAASMPLPAVARPANPVNLESKPNSQSSRRHRHKEYQPASFPLWLKIGLAAFVVFWLLIIILIKMKPHP